ncbi:MAG: serine/threonine protein phosphatase [Lachnospiraceae bacterium]
MNTEKRLTGAYKNAKVLPVDEKSKYIIFSDCHRSNGSNSDEFTKNQNVFLYALSYYYKNGFSYIEAGDGDELWEQPKFRYIRKAHYYVFDLLKDFYKEDRLEILYGNHNIYLKNHEYLKRTLYSYYNDSRDEYQDLLMGLEPCEAILLKKADDDREFLILHGHQGDLFNDQLWFFSMILLKGLWRAFHAIGATSPASPVKNITRQHRIEKKYNKWIKKNQTAIICGHTHRYKFPRKDEVPYFNCGCCIYPDNITGIEIEGGNIMIVRWKVTPDEDGVLRIERFVIRGPMPLDAFSFDHDEMRDEYD